ncbi:NAD(P)/FAD-dependent oxidoreductase [Pararhizobium arenae]|uniref:NAD(P)/FAD-dependent oxidoreductase n=1 Tax=Pararhizobium arenae TaxID=1856850 RepID=UPI00094AB4A9|nr:FAD-binding oxidoreductase [Pararhizobium arenae]
MPSQSAVYELSWGVIYYRMDDAGRLIMGGRGPQRDAAGQSDYRHLVRHALKLWPQLKTVSWPWHWYGQVAVTQDHLPHLTEPEQGLHLMVGYNGRGIAMATVAGREIAIRIASNRSAAIALPVQDDLQPFPFHRFWRIGAEMTILRHRIADRLRGR